MTCMKIGNEKTWAGHGGTEETGHQFGLRIFFSITSMRPYPSLFFLKRSNFLLLTQPVLITQNKSGNRSLKCVLAEAVLFIHRFFF